MMSSESSAYWSLGAFLNYGLFAKLFPKMLYKSFLVDLVEETKYYHN
jgi:hypothetical protein